MRLLILLAVAAVFYALSRIASSTAREIVIPFADGEPSRDEVKAALERMGCLVAGQRDGGITGFLSGSGGNWGQEVTVTIENGRLRVRSCFSNSQVFGATKNQENVVRFRAEWDRRADFRIALGDPTVRASSETRAREVARNALLRGGLAVVAGLGLLVVTLFAQPRAGASPASKFYLAGLALLPLAYGVPRVWAALARLQDKGPE